MISQLAPLMWAILEEHMMRMCSECLVYGFRMEGIHVEHIVSSPQYHLLGDGAYPTKSYLLKPFRDDGSLTRRQCTYNRVHSSIQSVVQRGIGRLKGRFRSLQFLYEEP